MKGTFEYACPLLWMQVCIHTNGQQKACCFSDRPHSISSNNGEASSFLNEADMKDPLNNRGLKILRKEILEGKIPEICKVCFKLEEETGQSPRLEMRHTYSNIFNQIFNETKNDGSLEKSQVYHLDVSMGNQCNLACRMCTPYYSNKIEEVWNEKGINYNQEAQIEVNKFTQAIKKLQALLMTVIKLISKVVSRCLENTIQIFSKRS